MIDEKAMGIKKHLLAVNRLLKQRYNKYCDVSSRSRCEVKEDIVVCDIYHKGLDEDIARCYTTTYSFIKSGVTRDLKVKGCYDLSLLGVLTDVFYKVFSKFSEVRVMGTVSYWASPKKKDVESGLLKSHTIYCVDSIGIFTGSYVCKDRYDVASITSIFDLFKAKYSSFYNGLLGSNDSYVLIVDGGKVKAYVVGKNNNINRGIVYSTYNDEVLGYSVVHNGEDLRYFRLDVDLGLAKLLEKARIGVLRVPFKSFDNILKGKCTYTVGMTDLPYNSYQLTFK